MRGSKVRTKNTESPLGQKSHKAVMDLGFTGGHGSGVKVRSCSRKEGRKGGRSGVKCQRLGRREHEERDQIAKAGRAAVKGWEEEGEYRGAETAASCATDG